MPQISIPRLATLFGLAGLAATLSAASALAQPASPPAGASDAPYQYREGTQPRADLDDDDDDEGEVRQAPARPRFDRNDWRDRDDDERSFREGRRRSWESRWEQRGHAGHPGMMHGGAMMRFCGPGSDRMAERMLDRLEALTNPMEAQRAAFQQLKDAVTRAAEIAREGCATQRAITPTGRLAAAEKRLEALLQAVKTVRPAMDAFYAMLNDEQKAELLMAQPRYGRMGSWRDRGGDRDERRGGEAGMPSREGEARVAPREPERRSEGWREQRREGWDRGPRRWREDDGARWDRGGDGDRQRRRGGERGADDWAGEL